MASAGHLCLAQPVIGEWRGDVEEHAARTGDVEPHFEVGSKRIERIVADAPAAKKRSAYHGGGVIDEVAAHHLVERMVYHARRRGLGNAGLGDVVVAEQGHVPAADGDVWKGIHELHLRLQAVGHHQVVVVGQCDVLASGCTDTGVEARHIIVLALDDAQPTVLNLGKQPYGGVAAAVVNHNQLKVVVVLCQYAVDGLSDVFLSVSDSHHHGDHYGLRRRMFSSVHRPHVVMPQMGGALP